jgi:hypothetical protein
MLGEYIKFEKIQTKQKRIEEKHGVKIETLPTSRSEKCHL